MPRYAIALVLRTGVGLRSLRSSLLDLGSAPNVPSTKPVDLKQLVGDLAAGLASLSPDSDIDDLPPGNDRIIELHGHDGVVLSSLCEHNSNGVPFHLAPHLRIVSGEERHDELRVLAVHAFQFQVATAPLQFRVEPFVEEHALFPQHTCEPFGDVPDEWPMLTRNRERDREWALRAGHL